LVPDRGRAGYDFPVPVAEPGSDALARSGRRICAGGRISATGPSMNPLRKPQTREPPPPWSELFGRQAPLEVDVGSGRAHFLLDRARQNPAATVLAFDIRTPQGTPHPPRLARE